MQWIEHAEKLPEFIAKNPNALRSPLWRIENLYPIYPKDSPPIPFKLNKFQRKIFDKIVENEVAGVYEMLVVLKARQLGITTFFVIYFLDRILSYGNQYAVIQADCDKNLNNIFRITRMAYESMYPGFRPPPDPKKQRYTRTIIEIPVGNSTSYIEIALEVRAKQVNMIHFSEHAFMETERLNRTLGSLSPRAFKATESTANGINNFHDVYQAQKKKGYSFFFGCQEQEEYSIKLPLGQKKLKDLNSEEVDLKKNFGLTDEQILFRREKLDAGMLPKDFKAHYPYDDIQPFMLSGNTMIELSILEDLKQKCEKIKPIEEIIIEESSLRIKIFKKPKNFRRIEKTHWWFCGVDPAQGVGQEYSAGVIVENNITTGLSEVVATFRGYANQGELAEALYKYMKKYYFYKSSSGKPIWPKIVVESNMGHTVLDRFLTWNSQQWIPVQFIYFMDWIDKTRVIEPGFKMTKNSRTVVLQNLSDQIREKQIKLNDIEIVNELRTFIYKPSDTGIGGRYQHEEGKTDDLIFALAMAVEGYTLKWKKKAESAQAMYD